MEDDGDVDVDGDDDEDGDEDGRTQHRKKRIKITYHEPESLKPLNVGDDPNFFLRNDVPDAKHHRSKYLDRANRLIEEYLKRLEDGDGDGKVGEVVLGVRYVDDLSEKLFSYATRKRNHLTQNHRSMLWLLRARLSWCHHLLTSIKEKKNVSKEEEKEEKLLDELSKSRLLVSPKRSVIDYTLNELWRSLVKLASEFTTLKYANSLYEYVKLLLMCAGKFLTRVGNARDFNNIRLRKEAPLSDSDGDGGDDYEDEGEGREGREGGGGGRRRRKRKKTYQINTMFLVETERLFFGLQLALHCRNRSASPKVVTEPSASELQISAFMKWVVPKTRDPFLEFVEKDLSERIYDWRVRIGERERYEREDKMGDPNSYNVIAKYRTEEIDGIMEKLDASGVTRTILRYDERDANNNSSSSSSSSRIDLDYVVDDPTRKKTFHVDVDRDGLCTILLDYCFDSIFSSTEERFSDRFVVNKFDLWKRRGDLGELPSLKEDGFPIMVQTFNEYGVYYGDTLYRCEDVPSCFVTWLRIACEDTSWSGAIPGEPPECNLVDLYESFFPEQRDRIQKMRRDVESLTWGNSTW